MTTRKYTRTILNNVFWFLASFILAFIIWFVATVQANPIAQQPYRSMAVQIIPPEGLTVTNRPTSTARVDIQAQQSVLDSLTPDDIVVKAIINQSEPGQYTIPLTVEVASAGGVRVETQPRQITVQLERIISQQKSVVISVTETPPVDYSFDEAVVDILQAEVSGAASKVEAVAEVRGEVNLIEQRTDYESDVTLVAYDSDGQRVSDVTITPRTAYVTINVYQRDDVRQIAVSPDIQFETLPDGYVVSSIRTTPPLVYIGGTPAILSRLGDSIETDPIDLTGRTEDFEITIPLELSRNLLVLSGDRNVTVSVGLTPLTTARQFDNITIEATGVSAGYDVTISPPAVSVILNGPIDTINSIAARDVSAVLNLAGIEPGSIELVPEIIIKDGQVSVDSSQLIPAAINVTVEMLVTPTQPSLNPETTSSPDTP